MLNHNMFGKKRSYYYLILVTFSVLLLLMPAAESRAHEFSRETAVVKAVREVSPAVVNISSAVQTALTHFSKSFSRTFLTRASNAGVSIPVWDPA